MCSVGVYTSMVCFWSNRTEVADGMCVYALLRLYVMVGLSPVPSAVQHAGYGRKEESV